MKTALFLMVIILSLSRIEVIQAQRLNKDNDKMTNTLEAHNSFYIKELKLSDTQTLRFNEIHKSFEKDASALREVSDKEKFEEKFKALEQQRDEEIRKILSKKQYKTFIDLRRKHRKNLQGLIRKQR